MLARSLLLLAPGQFGWSAESLGPPASQQLLVQTRISGISMGTELALYRNETRRTQPLQYPLATGYEMVGEVIQCGRSITGIKLGDRVVTTAGHRTHALIAATQAIPVPQDLDDAVASLVILACEAAKGVSKLHVQPHDTVLITGAGTLGLLSVFNLRMLGISAIDVVEPRPERQQVALALGARRVFTPAEARIEVLEYASALECSGQQEAFSLLQQQVRAFGRICVLADARPQPLQLLPAWFEKEQTMLRSSDGDGYRDYATRYWPHARQQRETLASLFGRVISYADLPETFAELAADPHPPIKVLATYPGDLDA